MNPFRHMSSQLPLLLLSLLLCTSSAAADVQPLPAEWPADAAPPDDARIVMSSMQQWTQSIAFEVNAPEERAVANITEQLESSGWDSEYVGRVGNRQSLRFTNLDGRKITVLAHATLEGSTAVLFTIYQPA